MEYFTPRITNVTKTLRYYVNRKNYCDNVMLVRYHIGRRSPNKVLRVLACISIW